MIRVANQHCQTDCGPVAVYNLVRVMKGDAAPKGGYALHRSRLARACGYKPGFGAGEANILRAAELELDDIARLVRRRATWPNLTAQLERRGRGGRSCGGLVSYWKPGMPDRTSHIVAVWINYEKTAIWAANAYAGSGAALWAIAAAGKWWPTQVAPRDEHLHAFHQVVF